MKRRIFLRLFPWNRLTFPLLLNVWEKHGVDREFEIRVMEGAGATGRTSLPEALRDARPGDVILYSFMTPHLPWIAAEIKEIRDAGHSPLLVAGGPHVSGEQELAAAVGFDVLFAGPGETTFLRFAGDLLDGKMDVGGACYDGREAGQERGAKSQAPANWDFYIPASRHFKSLPPLEIMRGCFWRCRYCQTGSGRPLFRSPSSISEYLEEAKRRRFKRVSFISPSALEFGASKPGQVDLACIESLLSQAGACGFRFVEYGIFPSEIRPENISREGLRLLRSHVANRRLTIGVQSGLDEQLKFLARGHSTAAIENAVELANAEGFQVNLDFIFALPDETAEARRQNLEFILSLHRKYRIHAHLHHFFPVAGSSFAFRLPSFLAEDERRRLLDLRRSGIATDWWLEGERRALDYIAWLKRDHPAFLARYT